MDMLSFLCVILLIDICVVGCNIQCGSELPRTFPLIIYASQLGIYFGVKLLVCNCVC